AGALLYLEGYQWDASGPRSAMRAAIDTARAAGRKVALTLSAEFCVNEHRADWLALMHAGQIDILFGNAEELLALAETDDYEAAVAKISPLVPLLVATHGPQGARAITRDARAEVPAAPVDQVLDTTGAGDLFAAGFLTGQARGADLRTCLEMGAICAAECISHVGPRPQVDLSKLVGPLLP
ncbi:MAG: adenosine kinase, partial [Alphaproteobacteria bacterium]|nr:adenosine kinase [Alphaproteobacteria bacterium]